MNEKYLEFYDYLKSENLTDLDAESFQSAYSEPEKYEELWGYVSENNLTDLSKEDFFESYFGGVKKKEETVTDFVSEPGSLVSPEPEVPVAEAVVEEEVVQPVVADATRVEEPALPIEQIEQPDLEELVVYEDPGAEIVAEAEGEKNTWVEDFAGKNFVTDFFGDIYRAGAAGKAQGASVDESLELMTKGKDVTDEDIEDFIAAQERMANQGESDEMKEFNKIYEANGRGWLGFLKGTANNLSILPQLFVSSVSAMALNPATLAAGAAGAGTGAAVGATGFSAGPLGVFTTAGGALAGAMGAMGTTLETGLAFSEFLQEELEKKGLEMTTEGIRKVLEDPEAIKSMRYRAAGRGIAIGFFNAATAGLGSQVVKSVAKATGRKVVAGLAGAGVEVVSESTGEVVGRLVAGQEMDVAEIGFEGFAGGVPQVVGLGRGLYKSPTYKINNETVSGPVVADFIKNAPVKDLVGATLEIKNDPVLKDIAVERRENARMDAIIKAELAKAGITDEGAVTALTKLEKERRGLEGNGTRAAQQRLAEVNKEIDGLMDGAKIAYTETVDASGDRVTTEVIVTKEYAKEELIKDGIKSPTEQQVEAKQAELFEEAMEAVQKPQEDAIQEPSPETVDAPEPTRGSEAVGEGVPDIGEPTAEVEAEDQVAEAAPTAEVAVEDDESGGSAEFREFNKGRRNLEEKGYTQQAVRDIISQAISSLDMGRAGDVRKLVNSFKKLKAESIIPKAADLSSGDTVGMAIMDSSENLSNDIYRSLARGEVSLEEFQAFAKKFNQPLPEAAAVVEETVSEPTQEVTEEEQVDIDDFFSDKEIDGVDKVDDNLVVNRKQLSEDKAETAQDERKISRIKQIAKKAAVSLKKQFPDVRIVLHETEGQYKRFAGKRARGAYVKDDKTKTIHINLSIADLSTVPHEVFHALLLEAAATDPQALVIARNMLESVRKVVDPKSDMSKAIEKFVAKYEDVPVIQDEEYLAELMGILSSQYRTLDKPSKNTIKEFLRKLAKLVGIDTKFGLDEFFGPEFLERDEQVIDLLNTISGKVSKGQFIEAADVKTMGDILAEATPAEQAQAQREVRDFKRKERERKAAEDNLINRSQAASNFTDEQLTAFAKEGILFHGSDMQKEFFDSRFIKEFNYGYGFYFTGVPALARKYGDKLSFVDTKQFNLLDGDEDITQEDAQDMLDNLPGYGLDNEFVEEFLQDYIDDEGFENDPQSWSMFITEYISDYESKAEIFSEYLESELGFDGMTTVENAGKGAVPTVAVVWNFDLLNDNVLQDPTKEKVIEEEAPKEVTRKEEATKDVLDFVSLVSKGTSEDVIYLNNRKATPRMQVVTEKDGKPVTFYHGTDKKFDKFEPQKSTRTILMSQYEVKTPAIFFTPDEAEAREYGDNIIPVNLQFEKLVEDNIDEAAQIITDYYVKEKDGVIEVQDGVVDLSDYYDEATDSYNNNWVKDVLDEAEGIDWMLLDEEALVEKFKEAGFDGTKVYEGDKAFSVATFYPENIVRLDQGVAPRQQVSITDTDSTNPSFEKGSMKDFSVEGGILEIGKVKGAKQSSVLRLSVDEDNRRQGKATELLKSALNYTNGMLSAMASKDAAVGLNYKLGMRAFSPDGNELSLEETKNQRAENAGESIRMELPDSKKGNNYKAFDEGMAPRQQVADIPQSAKNVLYGDSDVLPKPSKKKSNSQVAQDLAEVAAEYYGGEIITSKTITPEQEETITEVGTEEAIAAFEDSGKSAADWYSTAIEKAMAVAAVIHPSLSSKEEASKYEAFAKEKDPVAAANFVMRVALAITSQNLNVEANAKYANEQFDIFKKTGRFDASREYGTKAKSISSNLRLANVLVEKIGLNATEDFVLQEFNVSELEVAASKALGKNIKVSGLRNDSVNGAALFGPKIGQGFLQNLMGKFDPVTIDLWLRRTWGRWTGDVVGVGVKEERMARLLNGLKEAKKDTGVEVPDVMKKHRVVRKVRPSTGASYDTMSDKFISELEEDADFRDKIAAFAKTLSTKGDLMYKLIKNEPMSDGLYKAFISGEKTYGQTANQLQRIKDKLSAKYKDYVSKEKAKGRTPLKKSEWVKGQNQKDGRVNSPNNEAISARKPEWVKAATSITNDLKPIDIPTNQDRKVITRIVNDIKKRMTEQGYPVTNADVQALLWYPEKDIWAKLRGEKESNLKQSYDDQFIKIAEQKGLGKEAKSAAENVERKRAAQPSGVDERKTDVGVSRLTDKEGVAPRQQVIEDVTAKELDTPLDRQQRVFRSGDLENKAEPRWKFRSSRETGHFGTGFYFFGTKEQADKYDARDVSELDIDKYNLAKATKELHQALRVINDRYNEYYTTEAVDELKKEPLRQAVPTFFIEEVAEAAGMDVISEAEAEAAATEVTKALTKDGNPAFGDSVSTLVMKALGFDGVNAVGTSLDNSKYGTVIYDLKEDVAPRQQKPYPSGPEEAAKMGYLVHASDKSRDSFDKKFIKGRNRTELGALGFYFTANAQKAKDYGGEYTYIDPADMNLLNLDEVKGNKLQGFLSDLERNLGKLSSYRMRLIAAQDKTRSISEFNELDAELKKVDAQIKAQSPFGTSASSQDRVLKALKKAKAKNLMEAYRVSEYAIESRLGRKSDTDAAFSDLLFNAGYDGIYEGPGLYKVAIFDIDGLNDAIVRDDVAPRQQLSDIATPLPRQQKSVREVVQQARDNNFKDAATKDFLQRKGVPTADIDKAIKTLDDVYARVMKEIDGVITKSQKRGVDFDTQLKNALAYLQGTKLYEDTTDIHREKLMREVRAKFDKKEKRAPSAKRILGNIKDVKKVTLSEKEALKMQLRLVAKTAKTTARALVVAGNELTKSLKEMVKGGVITANQMSSVLRRFSRVDLFNPASIDSFLDYMAKIFADAEYGAKIARIKKLLPRAKKNIKSKIGVADVLGDTLTKLFNVNPTLIPMEMLEDYQNLLEMMGAAKKVLPLADINDVTEMANKLLNAVYEEVSMAEDLAEVFANYENKVIKDGKVDYAATIEAMIADQTISLEEAAVMRKYKSRIVEPTTKEPKTEAELAEERAELMSAVEAAKVNVSRLVMEEERTLARQLAKLMGTEAIERLSNQQLETLLAVIDNINNGFVTHAAQRLVEAMNASNRAGSFLDSIVKAVPLPVSTFVGKIKAGITKNNKFFESVKRNPLAYIDQVFGDFQTTRIYDAIFKPLAKAYDTFSLEMKRVDERLTNAQEAVMKSFKNDPNKARMSSYKMMAYMLQREFEANPDNKQVNPAADFIRATIDHINKGQSFFKGKDAEMLQQILDDFGGEQIDSQKLYDSFNKAERNALSVMEDINKSMGSKAVFTGAVIRGRRVDALNQYAHHNVLSTSGQMDKSADVSLIEAYNQSMRASTKAKNLIERTGAATPLNFDVFSSVSRGSRFTLTDFYLTEPIRTSRKTISDTRKLLEERGDVTKQENEIINAVENALELTLDDLLTRTFSQSTMLENVIQYVKKTGYRLVLASGTRAMAEGASNLAFAAIYAPKDFAVGRANKTVLGAVGIDVMSNLKSTQLSRMYPNEILSGRMIDTSVLGEKAGDKGGRAKSDVLNKATQIYNGLLLPAKKGVEVVADTLISYPDKAVIRPLWFGSFENAFVEITGKKPDFEKIAANDEAYMAANQEALNKATDTADQLTTLAGAADNPFKSMLRGKYPSKAKQTALLQFFNNFNSFMTRFLIYEYISARTAVNAMLGNGMISKRQGAALLGAVTTRMVVYTLAGTVLNQWLKQAFGLGDEEDEKDIEKQFGQALASTATSLIVGRDFGNVVKGLLNYGVENLNEEFLDELRDGDYDPYRDAIAYTFVPPDREYKSNTLSDYIRNLMGPFGPFYKMAEFGVKTLSADEKKDPAARIRQQRELNERLPLELLGNLGLIPLYRDIRALLLADIYKGMGKEKKGSSTGMTKAEKAQMKEYFPEMYEMQMQLEEDMKNPELERMMKEQEKAIEEMMKSLK